MSTYQTLRIEGPSSTGVATVFLSNGKVNAMSSLFFQEIGECFTALAKDTNIRCCVLRADGKYFTVGLDLKDAASSNNTNETSDSARKALKQRLHVLELQATFTTPPRHYDKSERLVYIYIIYNIYIITFFVYINISSIYYGFNL